MTDSFAVSFFRIYDRKLAAGEITFRQTGIKKEDFTKLCTDGAFVPPRAEIERLSAAMKLTEEECQSLLCWAQD